MFNLIGGYRYVAVACTVLLVVGLSFWAGYRVASAHGLARELEVARAYNDAANANLEAGRREAEAATTRVVAVRRARQKALSRVGELERALANLPRRPECDFSTDELRTLTALHNALFTPGGGHELSSALRTGPGAEQPPTGLRAPADGVGFRVQQPAR